MLHPHRERWTEEQLTAIQPREHDFQEFKGSAWLNDDGAISASFSAAFSKQVSAFANGAGGHLFIGLDDDGRIDGGVPVNLKSGGIKSWLEDVTARAVDPPLPSFEIYEVCGEGDESQILSDHAIYVVEIPSSDAAPHQSADRRYYLRIAGKSRPMGHVHLQDVLRRTRHPQVRLTRLGPFGAADREESTRRGPEVLLSLRAFLHNQGHNLARHVGGEIILPRPLVTSKALRVTQSYEGVRRTQRPGEIVFFKYLPTPLFPTQETFFQRFWISVRPGSIPLLLDGRAWVHWRVFADDAPPFEGGADLANYGVVRHAISWVQERQSSSA